jgi:hypothetical protein
MNIRGEKKGTISSTHFQMVSLINLLHPPPYNSNLTGWLEIFGLLFRFFEDRNEL